MNLARQELPGTRAKVWSSPGGTTELLYLMGMWMDGIVQPSLRDYVESLHRRPGSSCRAKFMRSLRDRGLIAA